MLPGNVASRDPDVGRDPLLRIEDAVESAQGLLIDEVGTAHEARVTPRIVRVERLVEEAEIHGTQQGLGPAPQGRA